jgi:hypothetical protein
MDPRVRWQRLPEMDRLGDFLFRHVEGIAAYCDHPVRFGVVESINTTIKAVLRRARGMRDDAMLLLILKMGDRPPDSVRSRLGVLSERSTSVLKSVMTAIVLGGRTAVNAFQ